MVPKSMPFSRYPSLSSLPADRNQPAGEETDKAVQPRGSGGSILDPEQLPTWQRPFVLGPNVRFTRTPHKNQPASGVSELIPGQDADVDAIDEVDEDACQSPVTALQARIVEELPAERQEGGGNPNAINEAVSAVSTVATSDERTEVGLSGSQQVLSASAKAVDFLFRPILPPQHQGENAEIHADTADQPVAPNVNAAAERVVLKTVSNPPADHHATSPETDGSFAFIPDGLAFEMMGLGLLQSGVGCEPSPQADLNDEQIVENVGSKTEPDEDVEAVINSEDADVQGEECCDAEGFEDEYQSSETPTLDENDGDAISPVSLYRQVTLRDPTENVAGPQTSLEAVECDTSAPSDIDNSVADDDQIDEVPDVVEPSVVVAETAIRKDDGPKVVPVEAAPDYHFPAIELLQSPRNGEVSEFSQEALEQSAGLLESILEDFGVKGEIIDVRPGPVVTLYEFEPAPGVKSSRVINLSDDIARSMSALSARVAVIPGRNVIGIELPNEERETVYLRALFESRHYQTTDFRLPLCLGKNIGGEPVIAELAKMPHLLVAGTTGSGKSVAINTMILSLLYHLRPEECRLIMVDPKMLELSVYDGIPHLLTPVVTDPKKAVLALKWAVREMEDRYRKMSRLGVRNIDGFNKRVAEARASGETIMVSVPTGFDRTTGEQIFEDQELDLSALPYIVVIVDEMADLMMVAGKEIEGTIQRLAQMARAAGIHLIMATQRPSVDVITGTIKANFPTRISFQVTSKIDSRTILGEQGAEYLLGQGDMLHMKGGGRIARVHGPFVSDYEVEKVVAHLKRQGTPTYLGSVTVDEEDVAEDEDDSAVFDATEMGASDDDGDALYGKAVKIVQRDKKCSTSYIQRRLSIGYNRAASLVERMEEEGLVGPANHVGKREILDPGSAD